MQWHDLSVAPSLTHHIDQSGLPVYAERFDEVLKFHAPGLAPVFRSGLAWHIFPDGAPAYTLRFRRTFGFYESLAAVNTDNGWHHISPSGEPIYEERYAWCGNFQGGRCPVRLLNGTYRHIDKRGYPIDQMCWQYAGDYRDGIAVVQASDGLSTHIDQSGQLLHDCWFIDLDVFHKGFARARMEDGWTHITTDGHPIYTRRFAAVEPFYNGQARVERPDGGLEIINEHGQTLVELRPARRSDFAQLSGDMVGFWRTQTIGAAVHFGVPDLLPTTAVVLAERCGMTQDGATRLLRALDELALAHDVDGCWQLTPRGMFLRRDHSLTLADAALEYAGPFSKVWAQLPLALSAASAWKFSDVFEQVAQDNARCVGHHRMLRSYARHDYPRVAEVLDLSDGTNVIDAGGGLGVLANMALAVNPSLTITVLDRPEVIEVVQQIENMNNIKWFSADIFEPWGLQADAVLLSRVLHDWDDRDALRILARARQALPLGGRVFVIEMLLSEEHSTGSLCNLHLLMATGGRERTQDHYARLLAQTGFQFVEVRRLPALPSILVGVAS